MAPSTLVGERCVLVWIGFPLLGLPAGWLLKSVAGWVASVTERTREIGLLRAVGMSRRQLRRMLRYESVMVAAFGASLGLGIGVAFGGPCSGCSLTTGSTC
jgi:predicted lysophospholipase L1 biosynthesis ABC-type transport system permease subunit